MIRENKINFTKFVQSKEFTEKLFFNTYNGDTWLMNLINGVYIVPKIITLITGILDSYLALYSPDDALIVGNKYTTGILVKFHSKNKNK